MARSRAVSSVSLASVSCGLTLAVLFLVTSPLASGQLSMGSTVDAHQYDTIDLSNLAIYLNVPVRSKPGMIPIHVQFYGAYGPMVAIAGSWQPLNVGGSNTFKLTIYPSFGVKAATFSTVSCGAGFGNATKYTNFSMIDSAGVSHGIGPNAQGQLWNLYYYANPQGTCQNQNQTGLSNDGSGFTAYNPLQGGQLMTDKSGNTTNPTTFTDPNGNTVSQNPFAPITDSLGAC